MAFKDGYTEDGRQIRILFPYCVGYGIVAPFKTLGFAALWSGDREELIALARAGEFDLALEWQHGPRDFHVRNILRKLGRDLPVILILNWFRQPPADLYRLGYADTLPVPFTDWRDVVRKIKRVAAYGAMVRAAGMGRT